MSNVVALKAPTQTQDTRRRKRGSVTLFVHIKRTSMIARLPHKVANAS